MAQIQSTYEDLGNFKIKKKTRDQEKIQNLRGERKHKNVENTQNLKKM